MSVNERRGDSTMEVLLDEVEALSKPTSDASVDADLDRLLDASPPLPPPRSVPPPRPPRPQTGSIPLGATRPIPSVRIPAPSAPTAAAPSSSGTVPAAASPAPSSSGTSAAASFTASTPGPSSVNTVSSVTSELDASPRELAARALDEAIRRAQTTTEPGRRARAFFEAATIAEEQLGDVTRSLELLRQSQASASTFLPAMRAARRLLIAQDRVDEALPILDAEARLVADPARRAALAVLKASILEDRLGRAADARAAYLHAHELDRRNAAALKELLRADWDGTSDVERGRLLERLTVFAAADASARAELWLRRGQSLEREQRIEPAIDAYRQALAADASSYGALEALKRLAGGTRVDTKVDARREEVLAPTLAHEIAIEESPTRRARLRLRYAAFVSRELDRHDDARETLEAALREAPPELEEEILAALADELEHRDDEALLAVLGRWVERTPSRSTRIGLLLRMAELEQRDDDGERLVRARESLEHAISLDPLHVPTLQALGALYAKQRDWPALVQMHLREAEAAPEPERRAPAQVRVADVYERHLNAPRDAIAHHQRALAAAPDHAASFNALARLFRRERMHRELLELHRRELDRIDDDARRIGLWLAIGSIHEDLLDEPGRAIEAYEHVLELDPKSRVAVAALERAGERVGRVEVVVKAIDLEVELETDAARRIELLHRAGELLASHEPHGAIQRFRRVLELDAAHRATLSSLGRLHHALGQWDDLVDIHRRELELETVADRKSRIAYAIARLAADRLGRPDEALGWARRAFELDPLHASAARMLEQALRQRQAFADVAALLERELEALDAAPRQDDGEHAARAHEARVARAAFALGEVLEGPAGALPRAEAAYARARVDGALRPDALDALVRIATKLGRASEVVRRLEDEAAVAPDVRAMHLLVEAGRAAWSSSDESTRRRAGALFDAALEREPTSPAAWLGLEDVARRDARDARPDALPRALAGESRVLRDASLRAAALFDLGRQQRARGALDEARSTFEAMASLVPGDPLALDALGELATRAQDGLLRQRVEAELARHESDPRTRAVHVAYLARRASEVRAPDALQLWQEAVALEPDSLAHARALVVESERRGNPSLFASAVRHAASLEPSPEERASLRVRAALATERTAPEEAVSDLDEALTLAPNRDDAADALARILVRLGDADRAIERLRRAAQGSRSPAHAIRIAHLQAEVVGDLPAACATLSRAAAQLGETAELARLQAEYFERDGQIAAAITSSERWVALASPGERREAHLRTGLLALERARQPERAETHLEAALDAGEDVRTRAALAEAAFLRGDFAATRDRAAQWAAVAQGTPDEGRAWTLAMRAARAAGDREGTLRAATRAVALEGSEGDARRAFGELIEASSSEDRGHRLHALVQALREHCRARTATAGTYLDLTHVLARDLGRASEAADAMLEAVRTHPADESLRRALLQRLVEAGRDREAMAIAERRVDESPLDPEAWSELHLALAHSDRLPWLGHSLAVMGLALRTPNAPRARFHSMAPEALLALADIAPDAPVVGLLGALGEALPRLYPPDLEGYGTTPRERIAPRSAHPVRASFDRIAPLFGAPPFELFVHRIRGRGVALELGEPTYILVPAWTQDISEPAQTFLATRALALVAARLAVVDKLTPRELEILVASAVRLAVPGYGSGLTSEDVLDDQAKRIGRLLSRKARRTLDELAPRYAMAPVVDYAAFAARVHRASARLALVVADDLERSLDALRRAEREGQGVEPGAFLRASPLAQDLVRFHASASALELRRQFAQL